MIFFSIKEANPICKKDSQGTISIYSSVMKFKWDNEVVLDTKARREKRETYPAIRERKRETLLVCYSSVRERDIQNHLFIFVLRLLCFVFFCTTPLSPSKTTYDSINRCWCICLSTYWRQDMFNTFFPSTLPI
jgi:hypothetical protein